MFSFGVVRLSPAEMKECAGTGQLNIVLLRVLADTTVEPYDLGQTFRCESVRFCF